MKKLKKPNKLKVKGRQRRLARNGKGENAVPNQQNGEGREKAVNQGNRKNYNKERKTNSGR